MEENCRQEAEFNEANSRKKSIFKQVFGSTEQDTLTIWVFFLVAVFGGVHDNTESLYYMFDHFLSNTCAS